MPKNIFNSNEYVEILSVLIAQQITFKYIYNPIYLFNS